VLLVGTDDRVYWFDLTSLGLEKILEMRYGSSFLILYEIAVLRISENGELMWHVVHDDHTLSHRMIQEDILWMEDQHGEIIGFHLSSGQRVDSET
jgi:hypothetical protein